MARRPGLGRGLDALIPGDQEDGESTSARKANQGVWQVPIDQIQPNPQQPRSNLEPAALNELADSIREHGIIQPIIVSAGMDVDQYILVAGERRWRAAQIAGLTMVPVIERTVTEQGQLELALIENVQRADLSPLETAEAYQQLAANFNLTHEQIAERVGKSRTSVTNTMRLLNLPEPVRAALAAGKISEGHARALLGLPSAQAQRAALNTVLNLSLNVRQTEALVKKMSGERPPSKPKPQPSPEVRELETRLQNHFGTKVNLNNGKRGGSLVIYYYSDEELNTLLDKLLPE
ncbi:MAG: ParB/RepB/Spo0J family partition protein [Chloroflexota bacterium]|nr:ParB/RepB/Spo0J family partition protein [Chloroflexota bacterium]